MSKNITIEDIRKGQLKGLKEELENIKTYLNNSNIIIFGAGQCGIKALNMLKLYNLDKNVKAFCDNDKNKQGKYILDLKILSYFEVKKLYITSSPLFLVCSTYWDEIVNELEKNNEYKFLVLNKEYQYISRELFDGYDSNVILKTWSDLYDKIELTKVKIVHEMLFDKESKNVLNARINLLKTADWSYLKQIDINKKQYFLDEIFKFSDSEIFLDLGAFDGDSILQFAKIVDYKYKKIIAFEPNEDNYKKLVHTLSDNNIKNIDVYNMGTWSKKTILNFSSNESGSNINSLGKCKINVDSLDNLFLNIPITFIKMDIEGSEKETLLGAKEIIKKYKPKLAVCVYHRIEDIYELPLLIKNLVPEYKIYLRHHSQNLYETVCYACI